MTPESACGCRQYDGSVNKRFPVLYDLAGFTGSGLALPLALAVLNLWVLAARWRRAGGASGLMVLDETDPALRCGRRRRH